MTLSSSNTDVAKVPASVSVSSGSTTATFAVDVSTVATSQTVTITAVYGGVTRTTTLTVTPQPLSAAFQVKNGSKGTDTCTITSEDGDADCTYDGSSSRGSVALWRWTTTVGSHTGSHDSTQATSGADDGCNVLSGGTPVTIDGRPQYVNITVQLFVEDSAANKSATVSRTVRLYPNSECGYGF